MKVQPYMSRRRAIFAATLTLIASLHGNHLQAQMPAPPSPSTTTAGPGVLDRTEAATVMPASVFFRGQSATTQSRNSAGVRFANGRLMLSAMVDTGGYATAIAQLYQAYLITEIKLSIGDKVLTPGAYGFGFIEGDQMVLMDLGGNELFRTATSRDPALKRPTPLQILPAPASPGSYRLYLGRNYITFYAKS